MVAHISYDVAVVAKLGDYESKNIDSNNTKSKASNSGRSKGYMRKKIVSVNSHKIF